MEDRSKPNPDYVTPWYLNVRRSDYTKRQWRRLRPKIIAAAKADGVDPAYCFATHDVLFLHQGELSFESLNRALEHFKEDPCGECGGVGCVDSGGFTPWGSPINLPCPSCSVTVLLKRQPKK